MKKYRKQIYRITSLLCSIVLIVTLAALPAAASSVDYDTNFVNYFDYNVAEVNYDLTQSNNSVTFPLLRKEYIRLIDLVVFVNDAYGLSAASFTRGSDTDALTVVPVGSGFYRIYGRFSGGVSAHDNKATFNFTFSSATAEVQFIQFRYSTVLVSYFAETAGIYAEPSNLTTYSYMANATSPVNVDFTVTGVPSEFYGWVNLNNWRKYDYMDVMLKIDTAGLTSLLVELDGSAIPYSLSFLDSNFDSINHVEWDYDSSTKDYTYHFTYGYTYQWVIVHIDCSLFSRTTSQNIYINFTGDISGMGIAQGIQLSSVRGYIFSDNNNQLAYLFANLKDYLADLFGKDDPGAAQAAQSQEQLNVEINNQVSAAVSDWDVHIVEVQDGYDSGFEGAVPALSWLSSLAEGIFGNMGWFGSIYLLVGLISVYVLFLNKGGLIGRKLK